MMIAEKIDEMPKVQERIMVETVPLVDDIDENEDDKGEQAQYRPKMVKDRSMSFLTAQIVMCAIALLIVIALKMVGGYYYEYSRSVFDECFNKPINKMQIFGSEQARAVVAAQSTVYGMGGESADDSVLHYDSKNQLSSDQQKAISSVNRMALPVDSRTVTCEYGKRIHPISGKLSFHTGIDIGEDSGKPIYSVLDGVVRKTVENDADYGNYVIITHSNGVETMYAHCSKLNVSKGQSVKKGQVIALVGTTGLSTGPHLHFEVRINDTRLNPRWFINI